MASILPERRDGTEASMIAGIARLHLRGNRNVAERSGRTQDLRGERNQANGGNLVDGFSIQEYRMGMETYPMDTMTIGEFNESFPPLLDGVGFVVKNYTELLCARGHHAWAIVSGSRVHDGDEYDRKQGIDYTIRATMIPVPGISPYGVVVRNNAFRDTVRNIPFQLIHTHSPFFLGRFAEQLVRLHHIPLITTFHSLYRDDFYGFTHSNALSEYLVKKILHHYRFADQVWTPTEWSRQRLYEYGFDGDVVVVENGCDFALPNQKELRRYRERGFEITGIPRHIPTLMYVGQLKKEKNLDLIVDALDIMHKRHVPFHMVFVGTGPDRHHLESRIEKAKISPHVTFLGKISDREELKAIIATSSLFLFPSQYDTSALVLKEAAALSVPLLNTAGSSTAGMTVDGENGFIAHNSAQAYAEKLEFILGRPELCTRAGQSARETLYRSWHDVIDEVETRYRNLIHRK